MKLFLVFAFLLATVPTTLCNGDFGKLALQWHRALPQGFHPSDMDLTVHGLWTENFTGPWPASQCPVPWSPYITGIFALHWPHLFQRLQVHGDGHNKWFLGEEWRFYGGSSETLYGQVGFFHLAVDLKDMHGLVAAGFSPDRQNSISLATFKTAILAAAPVLSCDSEYYEYFSERGEILQELHICFPLHFLVIDCQICFDLISVVIQCPPQCPHNSPSDCSGPFIFFL